MMVQPVSPATVCELERVGLRHAFHQWAGPEIRTSTRSEIDDLKNPA